MFDDVAQMRRMAANAMDTKPRDTLKWLIEDF
jgi:hypothetical protein